MDSRIYITYDLNHETLAPENIKLFRDRPKGKFFFDSKIVPYHITKENKLHLIMIQYKDGFQTKYEFFDVVKKLSTAKDNIDKYVNSINSYEDKFVTKVSLLELVVHEQ